MTTHTVAAVMIQGAFRTYRQKFAGVDITRLVDPIYDETKEMCRDCSRGGLNFCQGACNESLPWDLPEGQRKCTDCGCTINPHFMFGDMSELSALECFWNRQWSHPEAVRVVYCIKCRWGHAE